MINPGFLYFAFSSIISKVENILLFIKNISDLSKFQWYEIKFVIVHPKMKVNLLNLKLFQTVIKFRPVQPFFYSFLFLALKTGNSNNWNWPTCLKKLNKK